MNREQKKTDKIRSSALHVMEGVEQPGQINTEAVKKLRSRSRSPHTVAQLVEGILSGNRTILSKAITLVESALPVHQDQAQEVIAACLRSANCQVPTANSQITPSNSILPESRIPGASSAIRIGITGVPGVGKSTFIEALGKHLTAMGHKLAVLAIDPSSSRSKGSILGDKTRMEELAVDPNAFIRPSPAAGSLGGVARKTRETIILCEAAGFDVIFVETVGVGQSETTVHSMVDFFLLLMLAGAGDELQGIKRGIIEMADVIMINKADGDNIGKAKAARVEYANALHLFPPPDSGWMPVVDICSAQSKSGIDHVWELITDHRRITCETGYFHRRRMEQSRQVFREFIEAGLNQHFFMQKGISHVIHKLEQEIMAGEINPYRAAQDLLEHYFRKS
jgi:LAO/AO transport system kinase